jgi:hypothetical protein
MNNSRELKVRKVTCAVLNVMALLITLAMLYAITVITFCFNG